MYVIYAAVSCSDFSWIWKDFLLYEEDRAIPPEDWCLLCHYQVGTGMAYYIIHKAVGSCKHTHDAAPGSCTIEEMMRFDSSFVNKQKVSQLESRYNETVFGGLRRFFFSVNLNHDFQ
jgi:hypothetical protein